MTPTQNQIKRNYIFYCHNALLVIPYLINERIVQANKIKPSTLKQELLCNIITVRLKALIRE